MHPVIPVPSASDADTPGTQVDGRQLFLSVSELNLQAGTGPGMLSAWPLLCGSTILGEAGD